MKTETVHSVEQCPVFKDVCCMYAFSFIPDWLFFLNSEENNNNIFN